MSPRDAPAPLVLWLHGGPGGAERPLFRLFDAALEDHAVVAYLDQRGSGRSFAWIEGVISYIGRQDNLAVRQAAFFALAINLLMVVAAIVSIMLTIPKRKLEAP